VAAICFSYISLSHGGGNMIVFGLLFRETTPCRCFFYVGKLLKIKLIFIEPYDFIRYPSLTGRLVAPIVDELLVQHPEQLAFFKNARFEGSIL